MEQVEPSFLFPPQKAAVVTQSQNTRPVFTHCWVREAAEASSDSLALGLSFPLAHSNKYCQTLNTKFFTSKTRVILFIWCISKASSNKQEKNNSLHPYMLFLEFVPSAEPCASSFADDSVQCQTIPRLDLRILEALPTWFYLSMTVIRAALAAFCHTAWPLSDRATKHTPMAQGEIAMSGIICPQIKCFGSTSTASWLQAESVALWYLSLTLRTLLFFISPYIAARWFLQLC